MFANNRCIECAHEWQDRPMGFALYHACPECGSAYWEWINYDGNTEPRRHTPSISLVEDDES
jgi:predicted  nucleic acid-binding Zn-ribbon protein